MEQHDRLLVIPRVTGHTVGSLGLNAEVFTHSEETNLWDFLADSGAQSLRVMHPEIRPRRSVLPATSWPVTDAASFALWRAQVQANPSGALLHRQHLRFAEDVPWLGTADRFLPRIVAAGVEPVASCGWAPHDCEVPLLADGGDPTNDAAIGWAAAASCYDAWFGTAMHLAGQHGLRRFLCCNEPENRFGWYHAPESISAIPENERWSRLFRGNDNALGAAWLDAVARQTGAVARFARMAIGDAAALLGKPLSLYGPTTVCWHDLWQHGKAHYDCLDWHHYHPDPHTFRARWPAVAAAAAAAGKGVAITEFNRMAGGTPTSATLFDMGNSLQVMDLLLNVLSLCRPGDPTLELACLYLLHHPSTHRNHKHLLYGNLDVADWSGRDQPLWDRGSTRDASEWLPSADELTIRHATPAYALFRMAARAAGACGGTPGPHAVLDVGHDNPSSSGPEDSHPGLRLLAVDQGNRLVLTILNPTPQSAPRVLLDLSLMAGRFATVIERHCTATRHDAVVGWHDAAQVQLGVPAHSCVQLIAVPWRRTDVRPTRIAEAGLCGNRARDGLRCWQTSRLRAIASIGGSETDLSDIAVQWKSSHHDIVQVRGSGLVQRRRDAAPAVQITASLPGGAAWPEITIPGTPA